MQCSSEVPSEPPRAASTPTAFDVSHDMFMRPSQRTTHHAGTTAIRGRNDSDAKIRKQIARTGHSASTESFRWPFRGSQFVSNDFKRTTLQLMAEKLASGVLTTTTASARSNNIANNTASAQNPSPPRRKFIWHTTLVEDARKTAGGPPTTITTTSMTTANHTMTSHLNSSSSSSSSSSNLKGESIDISCCGNQTSPVLLPSLMSPELSTLPKSKESSPPPSASVRSSTQITDWKVAVKPRNGNRREGILTRGTIQQQQGRTAHSHSASALCELLPHMSDSKFKEVASFDYYVVTPMEHGWIQTAPEQVEDRCCTLPSFGELLLSLDLHAPN